MTFWLLPPWLKAFWLLLTDAAVWKACGFTLAISCIFCSISYSCCVFMLFTLADAFGLWPILGYTVCWLAELLSFRAFAMLAACSVLSWLNIFWSWLILNICCFYFLEAFYWSCRRESSPPIERCLISKLKGVYVLFVADEIPCWWIWAVFSKLVGPTDNFDCLLVTLFWPWSCITLLSLALGFTDELWLTFFTCFVDTND